MRTLLLSRLLPVFSLLLLLVCPAAAQNSSAAEASKLLPERVGDFRAQGAPQPYSPEGAAPEDYGVASAAQRPYVSPEGEALTAGLVRTTSDAAAYSLLTRDMGGQQQTGAPVSFNDIGTAIHKVPGGLAFYKGNTFVEVWAADKQPVSIEVLQDFARLLAATLEEGSGSVPVLALHLPEWEKVQRTASYAVSLPALQRAAGNRPALEALSFEGGAEAVVGTYGQAQLVIVEFTTPQYASDSDARVRERVAQLRAQNQPVPSAYRRIGNYSAFVFDASDEQAAAKLLDNVKYEKDVRWLDRNPNMIERAQEAYGRMTGGVILASLKITGISILLCLGLGGLFGGAVFLYRRAQAPTEVYTDAGGMVRLNIDEITPEANPGRLLESGGDR